MSALAEMYGQGVSTRKVKTVTATLCEHSFSASAISGLAVGLASEKWRVSDEV